MVKKIGSPYFHGFLVGSYKSSPKFFSRRFFSDKFGGSLSFLTFGGIPTWKQVTITSPVVFQIFSSGDIQSMDRPNSTKAPHSPHFKSLHPKVELLKGLFSGEHCKKETLCLFVCARVDLPNRSKTCTVSAYHWDCVQRSYQ